MKKEDIEAEITEIGAKLQTCATEINRRQAEIAELKGKNAELVERNLGKERRPASLLVQRKRIEELTSHCQEFEFLKRNLEKNLQQANKKLAESSYQGKVNQYMKAEAAHLDAYQHVQILYSELMSAIAFLDKIQAGHCLARLSELVRAIGTDKLAGFGVEVDRVLAEFGKIDLPSDLDSMRIQRLQVNLNNLTNQLHAVATGARTFHKAKATPPPQEQRTIQPLTLARQLEEHRLNDLEALPKFKANRKQVHHRPHK